MFAARRFLRAGGEPRGHKKVVESLIKCGAFDGLKLKRSQLMAPLDSRWRRAGRRRRRGQLSSTSRRPSCSRPGRGRAPC